jgi:hypothetical protein
LLIWSMFFFPLSFSLMHHQARRMEAENYGEAHAAFNWMQMGENSVGAMRGGKRGHPSGARQSTRGGRGIRTHKKSKLGGDYR